MSQASITPITKSRLAALTLGSIGVVYGDIGTSPLYAFRESLTAAAGHGIAPSTEMVIGLLSLILWTIVIIVTCKYVLLVLRADNHGEGGVLSLMTLAQRSLGQQKPWLLFLGIAGAALFYGDAVITPAISVLSAVEGLKLVTHRFDHYILPIAFTVIILLFIVQARGTEKVARFFGPVMLLWFLLMAIGGLIHIMDTPEIWQALNPLHGASFLIHHGYGGLVALGAVLLAVTGAEALYADMGHFGRKPIRLAWFWLVMPSLMLNYIGQGALVLTHPEAAHNSFFLLYPDWALVPVVIMATLATVIASQAVITGAFSLTHQAIQLSLLPRLHVKFTSAHQAGQIYIPRVNWALLAGVLLLIEIFRSSSALASAYGIAVTGTMVITALLLFVIMRKCWGWSIPMTLLVAVPFLLIDITFLSANMLKFLQGGFIPVLLSIFIIMIMRIWVKGNRTLHNQMSDPHNSMQMLINRLNNYPPQRVEGTAVFLTSNVDFAPSALLHNLKHNHVLHERNILLTLKFETKPYVPEEDRITVEPVCDDFIRIFMRYGYMEPANVTAGLRSLRKRGLAFDMMNTSFFISRRNIVPSARFGMPLWQDHVFILMSNNATDAADYFHIPLSRVVELGVQMTV